MGGYLATMSRMAIAIMSFSRISKSIKLRTWSQCTVRVSVELKSS